MLKVACFISLVLRLVLESAATTTVYTGFNYGAFWSEEKNAKTASSFLDGFQMAKSLKTDLSFNSARLFSCIEAGTINEASAAFDAAVQTNTSLLLGFWITPSRRGDSQKEPVARELAALEKGFQKHGQNLSRLIIGLSVGSEDIYRWEMTTQSGLAASVVAETIARVKMSIAWSHWAMYMKGKPIGHVDTAQFAVVDNADFIGMTAYPYWSNESIAAANTSFHYSLNDVQRRAGNRPVWIAEMGWPFSGPSRSTAVASASNLQRFWSEVGCSVFGLYNTFWYELVMDSTPDQPDWGLVDAPRQLRIQHLDCTRPTTSSSAPAPAASSQHDLSHVSCSAAQRAPTTAPTSSAADTQTKTRDSTSLSWTSSLPLSNFHYPAAESSSRTTS